MVQNKTNRQDIAWCVPWAPPLAYDKKKSGGRDQVVSRYDGRRPDVVRGGQKVNLEKVRMASWNVGTMSRRSGEVIEVMVRRNIDFCCVQESRWKGKGTRMLGQTGKRYKFYYQGCNSATSGVGILIAERWIENVVKVTRVSERLMHIKVLVGKQLVNIVSAYAPQVGRSVREKDDFWEMTMCEIMRIADNEAIFLGGDLNGHVGESANGYEGVHGGFSHGVRNEEGERILEFCDSLNLYICNTMFEKDKSKLITYSSGNGQSVIDYFIARNRDRRMVTNVKVISSEECVSQHRLLVCECVLLAKKKTRRVYVPKLKLGMLKDKDVKKAFNEYVEREAHRVDSAAGASRWQAMTDVWKEAAKEVCGVTKGPPRHKETWWWNRETEKAVANKRTMFLAWRRSQSQQDKEAYVEAKKKAKFVVWRAQENKRREFAEDLDSEAGKKNFFRIAKQMSKEQTDVTGSVCIRDGDGKIVFEERKVKERWQSYSRRLMNEMNIWDGLTSCDVIEGPCPRIDEKEVKAALDKMTSRKAAGPSGIVSEMMQASCSKSVEWLTAISNDIVAGNGMPDDWERSLSIPLYKGKGDPLECGSYRTIKLLEHGMKVVERVLESRLRELVVIDSMQFGFMPGKSTSDAIFIVRQIQEKFLVKEKALFFAFVDLEKAFDRIPREVVRWALRSSWVPEWLVNAVMSLYERAQTVVRTKAGDSESFPVNVGVHQGSVLSPILFAIVMDQVTKSVRVGLPWELLYADDLVLIDSTVDGLKEKIASWKNRLESKGMRVNTEKTKIMISGKVPQLESGQFPCSICKRGVGANSIKCNSCDIWVHKRCSGVRGSLSAAAQQFVCRKCEGQLPSTDVPEDLVVQGDKYDCVQSFCYLGDTLSAAGGSDVAVAARVRSGWRKFHELAPFLTSRAPNLKMKGQVYAACVRSAMMYGSETWAVRNEHLLKFERTEKDMVRRMCGVRLSDEHRSEDLRKKMGLEGIVNVLRRRRLRWYGHVMRRDEDDWTKRAFHLKVDGRRPVGRPRKTWEQVISGDLRALDLRPSMVFERQEWRQAIRKQQTSDPVQRGKGRKTGK